MAHTRIGRTLATGLVAASLTGLGSLALAGPANATTTRCATSAKEYPTNGFNADIKVKLCIHRNWGGPGGSNSYKWATARVSWGDSGPGKQPAGEAPRVMHVSRGWPLTSALHDPHGPALQFHRMARSPAWGAWMR